MAFNRKPEKQILQQHRFEEFNQNSISKLISLRSTTHWHVLAESEQLQRESWNNTLSGPLAAVPHCVRARGLLACHLLIQGHFRGSDEDLLMPHLQHPASLSGHCCCSGSQKSRVARELAWSWGKSLQPTAELFQSLREVPNSNNLGKNKV